MPWSIHCFFPIIGEIIKVIKKIRWRLVHPGHPRGGEFFPKKLRVAISIRVLINGSILEKTVLQFMKQLKTSGKFSIIITTKDLLK